MTQKLPVKKLNDNARLPTRGTPGSAGLDLYASDSLTIEPGSWRAVPTGIAIQIPENHYGKIEARSGLAFKQGIIAMAGVLDSDYSGEVKAILFNPGIYPFEVKAGDRIAQLIIIPYVPATPVEVTSLDQTERGEGGFGSTGR